MRRVFLALALACAALVAWDVGMGILYLYASEATPVTLYLEGASAVEYKTESPYCPLAPQQSTLDSSSLGVDGGERRVITRRNVTEQVYLIVQGASASALQSALAELERMLLRAESRAENLFGAQVWLYYQPENYSAAYRSEILSAFLEPAPSAASVKTLGRHRVRVRVTFTRRFYWEGDEVELPLTVREAPEGATGGVTISNCNDGDPTTEGPEALTANVIEGTPEEGPSVYSYDGTLPHLPVIPGSFTIEASRDGGAETYTDTDDGAGGFTLDGLPGTIDYVTGEWTWNLTGHGDFTFTGTWDTAHRGNFVYLPLVNIEGSLPTPCLWKIGNPPAGYDFNGYNYHVCQSPHDSIAWLEAEDCLLVLIPTADENASGGYVAAFVWETSVTNEKILEWELTSEQVAACAGRQARVLARVTDKTGDGLWLTTRLQYYDGDSTVVVLSSSKMLLGSITEIVDLGLLQFPQNASGAPQTLYLAMYVSQATGGMVTVDYVQLAPLDGYRCLSRIPDWTGVQNGFYLVDDGLLNETRVQDLSDYLDATFAHRGAPLMLRPGVAHDFAFLWDGYDIDEEEETTLPALQSSVRLYYRPRRQTL